MKTLYPETLVHVYYSPEHDVIVLAKRDGMGWWKYFEVYDDFIHMDGGIKYGSPVEEGFARIGSFHTELGKTLTGLTL